MNWAGVPTTYQSLPIFIMTETFRILPSFIRALLEIGKLLPVIAIHPCILVPSPGLGINMLIIFSWQAGIDGHRFYS